MLAILFFRRIHTSDHHSPVLSLAVSSSNRQCAVHGMFSLVMVESVRGRRWKRNRLEPGFLYPGGELNDLCNGVDITVASRGYSPKAPAGRCKVVHLHPLDFAFRFFADHYPCTLLQSLTQKHRQTLFYRVKYDIRCCCSTSIDTIQICLQPLTSLWVCTPLEKIVRAPMPQSVERLVPTTPASFQARTHDPQFSNQIDASGPTGTG